MAIVSPGIDVARTKIMTSLLLVTERDRLLSFIAGKTEIIALRETVSDLTSSYYCLIIIGERRGLPPAVEPSQTINVSMCKMDFALRAVNGRQHRLVRPLSVANYPSSQG